MSGWQLPVATGPFRVDSVATATAAAGDGFCVDLKLPVTDTHRPVGPQDTATNPADCLALRIFRETVSVNS